MNAQPFLFRRPFQRQLLGLGLICAGLMAQPDSTSAQAVYSQVYTFTTFAGVPNNGSADGAGSDAQFSFPNGVAVDSAGNVYVADTGNDTIRKVTPAGVVTTLAGLAGAPGSSDGVGIVARFSSPFGLAVDAADNVYVVDTTNNTIRKVTPGGVVTTIAGLAGTPGSNDGTGTTARFNAPFALAVDSATNLYVSDQGNNTVRKLTPVAGTPNWMVSTLAGSSAKAGSANGAGTNALFYSPCCLAVDGAGNVYLADDGNETIRKITSAGSVTTIAGLAGTHGDSDGTGANALFYDPTGVAVDTLGNVYVADQGNQTVRQLSPSGQTWLVTTLAGLPGHSGDANGTGTNAMFDNPVGLAVDSAGNIYVADAADSLIREVNPATLVTTLAGSGTSSGTQDGTGTEARFFSPGEIATGPNGNFYVADSGNNAIRKISSAGVVGTLAGMSGYYGYSDGVGSEAVFNSPEGLTVDSAGNVYVTDTFNNAIRRVTPQGVVTTIAGLPRFDGNGNPIGGSADGTNSHARFNSPTGIALDGAGNLYVADEGNNTIRKMTPMPGTTSWVVTTIAGLAGFSGAADGMNSAARFNAPYDLALDGATNIYLVDQFNYTIRKIRPVAGTTNWVVSTIAGTAGVSGSRDGSGANALFGAENGAAGDLGPEGIALDAATNLYVADTASSTIRKIVPVGTNWMVTTIAGSAAQVGSADGAGMAAFFDFPQGVAVDGTGTVYVADTEGNTIRKGAFSQYTAANPVTFASSPQTGQLKVTLLPPEANGQWRFPWETAWRNSSTTAMNLAQGEYSVEFRNLPGYLAVPLLGQVAVTNGGTTLLTNVYYPTIIPPDATAGGSLTVNIGPSPPSGAGWRFLGDTTPFFPPGYGTNLLVGTYLIEFAPVAGFATPSSLSIQVEPGLPTVLAVTYLLAQTLPGNLVLPAPVPVAEISDLTDYPFGFNGQLQTDVGYGSGVAVETNVVLTAAHLIFNDQTLSFVSQAYWFSHEEAGIFAPDPLVARGWYVLSGYAGQRTNDVLGGLGPDQSSPQSRNMDVAALYFPSPVANGGYGGYLPSDETSNTWLMSTSEKMLVGYPVDGSQFGFNNIVNGDMYVAGPQPYPLSKATDPVADQQVYTAPWLLSYPGNSGGPLYVQYDGYYYPAGVYLGTLFNGTVPYASAVRAIDSNVVSLISLAAALGDTGTNNHGGGVITIIPSLDTSVSHPGYLILQLGPPSAVQAGAAWKLTNQSDSFYSVANPSLQEITSTNALALQFKPIPGWNLPSNRSVAVIPGILLNNVAMYTVTNPVLSLDSVSGLGLSGTTNTSYQIQSNSTLTGTWRSFKTNTLTNFGFNLITNHPVPGFYRALWLTN